MRQVCLVLAKHMLPFGDKERICSTASSPIHMWAVQTDLH